jgi:SAM-dependent methyltransferase
VSAPAPRTSITEAEQPGLRFGRVADEYERVRLSYPAALIDAACARAGLHEGSTVVEIGCGTGKLTRDLAARGLVVEAVEPDGDLIEVARRTVPEQNVRFHQARFEDIELRPAAFPAVFAATSFHWVDPAVGWSKVASVLVPGGVFALLTHAGGFLRSELDAEISRIWTEVSKATADFRPVDDETLWGGVDERLGNVSELWSWLTFHEDLASADAADLFEDVEFRREQQEQTLTIPEYLDRIRTSNYYLHLTPDEQHRLDAGLAAAIERHGGTYPATSSATLVTARRPVS